MFAAVSDKGLDKYMKKQSAGLLLYKVKDEALMVLLVHPGGPYFASKEYGVWSLPKGEFTNEEQPLAAAKREFTEETGQLPPTGTYVALGSVQQANGKVVYGWAVESDFDSTHCASNTFLLEWPPKSGNFQEIPEVDRAAWFTIEQARPKINPGQQPFLDRIAEYAHCTKIKLT
ncbi:MAG: NUDIX domain-containing protein [Candidatus Saccharimonadales bacterium]